MNWFIVFVIVGWLSYGKEGSEHLCKCITYMWYLSNYIVVTMFMRETVNIITFENSNSFNDLTLVSDMFIWYTFKHDYKKFEF